MPTYTDNTTFPVELRSIGELYLANSETTGGAADTSGNGRNFTASTAAPGSSGGLRTFNSAANNYLELTPIPTDLHIGSGPWYLHTKARFTGSGDQCIFSMGGVTDGQFESVLQFSNGNKILFIASPDGTSIPTFPIADASADTLHSIECWSDGAGISISVDGATSVGIGTTHPIHASTAPMRFGQLSNGSNKLNGAVGAVYMAKGALPSTGARAYLRAGSNPYAQAAGDTTKPIIASATVSAAGTLLTLAASKSITGLALADLFLRSKTAHTLSALSGSGSGYTLAISPAVQKYEGLELGYSGTAAQDTATTPNVMDTFVNGVVTNNSTVLPSDAHLAAAISTAQPVIATNAVTIAGIPSWFAGPVYDIAAIVDIWLAMSAYPERFTATEVKNTVNLFASRRNTDGLFSNYIQADGTALYWGGNDSSPSHIVGDSAWVVPLLIKEYYDRTGDISLYNTYKAHVKNTLVAIPRNNTSHLVYVDPADIWTPMGFQDGIFKAGDDLHGSVFYWMGSKAGKALATAAGDSSDVTFYNGEMAAISGSISTLFDSGSGMFKSCSVAPNNVIDIFASCLAVWCGLATTPQIAGISAYLVAHINTIADSHGYIAQSPVNWPGGPRPADGHGGAGSYDDGFWAYGILWVIDAINRTSPVTAETLLTTYLAGNDPTQEWFRRTGGSGDAIGSTTYLATVGQAVGAARLLAGFTATPVATPTFSPVAGAVASGTLITFSSTTSGATFYSTIDGSTPTTASTAGATRTVTTAGTIKVLAVKAGMTDSAVASAAYAVLSDSETVNVTLTRIAIRDRRDTFYLRGKERLTLEITGTIEGLVTGDTYLLSDTVVSLSTSAVSSPFPPDFATFTTALTAVMDGSNLEAVWFVGEGDPAGDVRLSLSPGRHKLWLQMVTRSETIVTPGPTITVIA